MIGRTVRLSCADGIAVIGLNRPDQRNALNLEMCLELAEAARIVEEDEAVRVVILRGEGTAFCAGADLKERRTMTEDEVRVRRMRAFAAYDAIERLTRPCIAVVHGPAYGSGCEIAAACDFAIAGERATFCYPEATRGTIGATQRLPRLVGARMAKDLLFTGRVIDAREALRIGLITRIVPDQELERVAREIAAQIAAAPTTALRLTKQCLNQAPLTDPAGALANEIRAIDELLASEGNSGLGADR